MDIHALLGMLVGAVPAVLIVLQILGALLVVGQCVVVMTPTKADDEAWDKIKGIPLLGSILSALVEFAPLQKK